MGSGAELRLRLISCLQVRECCLAVLIPHQTAIRALYSTQGRCYQPLCWTALLLPTILNSRTAHPHQVCNLPILPCLWRQEFPPLLHQVVLADRPHHQPPLPLERSQQELEAWHGGRPHRYQHSNSNHHLETGISSDRMRLQGRILNLWISTRVMSIHDSYRLSLPTLPRTISSTLPTENPHHT